MPEWSPQDSAELYGLSAWSTGYFSINAAGNLAVTPRPSGAPTVAADLRRLVEDLRRRGIPLPVLLRFNGILEDRVEHLFGCFEQAIAERSYQGRYRGVYPIKVNQQRHVVEILQQAGRRLGLGLEVGSKPELLAVLALHDDPEALLICNGYKDRQYLETTLMGTRLGRRPIVVIERFGELEQLVALARENTVRPAIGLRARLASRGRGFWEDTGGELSKFGLPPSELVAAVELLRGAELLECLELLHFHVGSQITSIRDLQQVLREGARVFAELVALGAPLQLLDVGGGLGVDYDGSRTSFEVSKNYSDQEYARDVVWTVQEVCDAAGVPHPDLVTESGRALVAHHSVLVVDVLGTSLRVPHPLLEAPADDAPVALQNLWQRLQDLDGRNYREVFHDVGMLKEEVLSQFQHGLLSLSERAVAEEIAAAAFRQILEVVRELRHVPEEFRNLERSVAATCFCNFSVFQSLPDSWAMRHPFPVVPLQGHQRRPDQRAVLADVTCDSDGKVDLFIDPRNTSTLPLHEPAADDPYLIGFFLVGAYQEILGDIHNLFGDTSAVHVDVHADGSCGLSHVVEGDRVCEVLGQVEYPKKDLLERVRRAAEAQVRSGGLTLEESGRLLRRYEECLESYTYLVD